MLNVKNNCSRSKIYLAAAVFYLSLFSGCWQDTTKNALSKASTVRLSDLDTAFDVQKLALPIDTLELSYIFFACDCPNWLDDSMKTRYHKGDHSFPQPEGYYLEPTSLSVRIDERLHFDGNKIRVIGYLRSNHGLPDTEQFITDHPPMGNVLCYFSWEVIKPYCIYQ